jgi:hypothetical protein
MATNQYYICGSTPMERGIAGQYREQYFMPHKDYHALSEIVHEKNNQPTKLYFPTPNATWTPSKKWKN